MIIYINVTDKIETVLTSLSRTAVAHRYLVLLTISIIPT